MNLHPLDPAIVQETNNWFYAEHPRGQELSAGGARIPLDPTASEDHWGRKAWITEYKRRLAEKEARSRGAGSPLETGDEAYAGNDAEDDAGGGVDALSPYAGCCPTDFVLMPEMPVVETEESLTLLAQELIGVPGGHYVWSTDSARLSLGGGSPVPAPLSSSHVEGGSVVVMAGSQPNNIPERGELVTVTRQQAGCADITKSVYVAGQPMQVLPAAKPKDRCDGNRPLSDAHL